MENLLGFKFKEFFTGKERDFGRHEYNFVEDGEKEKGKSWTVSDTLITLDDYQDHLNGKLGLGIIPVMEDSTCKFTVIDIDVYDKSLDTFLAAIDNHNFPLVPFRSKSGGLHIYMFFEEPVPAKEAIDLTKRISSILAIDIFVKQSKGTMVEVFPKQATNQGKGSWINLPYYNFQDTKQYAIKNSKPLSLEDAVLLIEQRITSLNNLKKFLNTLPYNDAPPCLQSIYLLDAVGKNEGRNDYLFSWGAYFKKKDENYFEQHLFEINNGMREPIDNTELENTIIKSLRRKDYNYKCTQYPCVAFCNKPVCKNREYGVGKVDGYFSNLDYGQLTQYKTSQPYYEWEIRQQGDDEYKMLKFKNEDEIIRQDTFLKLCLRELYVLPIKLKQSEWFKIVNQSLQEIKIEIIEEEDELSALTLFRTLFLDFLMNRAMAATKDQMFAKKVYYDSETNEYMFRAKDLNEYVYVTKNFRFLQPGEVNGVLKDMGCEPRRIYTESRKQLRVQVISQTEIDKYHTMFDSALVDPEFEEEEELY